MLANNCTDATVAVVRQQARRFPQLVLHVAELRLPVAKAHVGRAHRLLMDEACARLEQVGAPVGIIASTDADTCVAPTWLAAIQAEIAAGADAVGGRIHSEISGASLLPLRRANPRHRLPAVVRPPRGPARPQPRGPLAAPQPAFWRVRRQLRAYWAGRPAHGCDELAAVATRLGLAGPVLLAHVKQAATFGDLWEKVLAVTPRAAVAMVPLSLALRELPLLIKPAQVFGIAEPIPRLVSQRAA